MEISNTYEPNNAAERIAKALQREYWAVFTDHGNDGDRRCNVSFEEFESSEGAAAYNLAQKAKHTDAKVTTQHVFDKPEA